MWYIIQYEVGYYKEYKRNNSSFINYLGILCKEIRNANLSKRQVDVLENTLRRDLVASLGAYRHTSHSKLLHGSGIEPLAIRWK